MRSRAALASKNLRKPWDMTVRTAAREDKSSLDISSIKIRLEIYYLFLRFNTLMKCLNLFNT